MLRDLLFSSQTTQFLQTIFGMLIWLKKTDTYNAHPLPMSKTATTAGTLTQTVSPLLKVVLIGMETSNTSLL